MSITIVNLILEFGGGVSPSCVFEIGEPPLGVLASLS